MFLPIYSCVFEETNLPEMNTAEMLIFFLFFFKRNVVGSYRIEHFVKKDIISNELQQTRVHFGAEIFPVRGYKVNPTWARMELRSSLQPIN